MEKMTNLGYCCINNTLRNERGWTTNRGMIKRTFKARGIEYAGILALRNLVDLKKIIEWNDENDVKVFRMSSSLFPWMTEYEFTSLPNYNEIKQCMTEIGDTVKASGQRIGFHPGHFDVLASPTPRVVDNTIQDLNQHAKILDLFGLPVTPWAAINVHINGVYGNKGKTFARLAIAFRRLDHNCQMRLTFENDDKPGQWSTKELHKFITQYNLPTPIVFDYHHHRCHPDGLTESDALALAVETWQRRGVKPLCHYSSSRQHEQPDSMYRAHSDLIYEEINDHKWHLDIELEAKGKEVALFEYLKISPSQKYCTKLA